MTTACATCPSECGTGLPKARNPDPVKAALCVIFCEVRKEFCEGKHKGKKKSAVAQEKAGKSNLLKRAITGKYGKGAVAALEKMRMVPFKNAPKHWGRSPMSRSAINRHLKPLRDQLMKKVGQTITRKAVQKAATGWMKLVPILNVLSTAYDVYDIATTGYDLYKSVNEALNRYQGDVYRVRPDVAIEGADGALKDIYDFKFDGDQWQPGQTELYNEALEQSGKSNPNVQRDGEVSQNTCKCDGKAKADALPNVS
ncbi:hypothetical protein [Rhizobium terrae]|uniref:hypothetical protein n=1 Tax=Rhizobium terrae TaxID=2171756 RepID=UPI000E3C5612|nr:hypothetical protein [Rhizobium terrae]